MKNLRWTGALALCFLTLMSFVPTAQQCAFASSKKKVIKHDPVPSPSIITSPKDGKEQGFTVQVYSFLDAQRAKKALVSLKNEGYKAFMEVSDLGDNGVFYRVRIGDLANEAKAQKLLEHIRKNFKDGFITKKAGVSKEPKK